VSSGPIEDVRLAAGCCDGCHPGTTSTEQLEGAMMRTHIGLKALVAVLTVGSIAFATAGATAAPHLASGKHETIVLNSGITPVKIGETKKAVVAALGKAHGTTCEVAAPVTCLDYASHGGKQNLYVTFLKGHVFYVKTSRTTDRTKTGIGVGVSWKKLVKAYPKCQLDGSSCFLNKPPKWFPKTGQLFTYVSGYSTTGSIAKKTIYEVVVGKYSKKYEGCAFGCG
jgi:hypothetical protein